MTDTQTLLNKIRALPPERRSEVEDFVDFIAAREEERTLVRGALAASTPTLASIWNNPEDDVYDAL